MSYEFTAAMFLWVANPEPKPKLWAHLSLFKAQSSTLKAFQNDSFLTNARLRVPLHRCRDRTLSSSRRSSFERSRKCGVKSLRVPRHSPFGRRRAFPADCPHSVPYGIRDARDVPANGHISHCNGMHVLSVSTIIISSLETINVKMNVYER